MGRRSFKSSAFCPAIEVTYKPGPDRIVFPCLMPRAIQVQHSVGGEEAVLLPVPLQIWLFDRQLARVPFWNGFQSHQHAAGDTRRNDTEGDALLSISLISSMFRFRGTAVRSANHCVSVLIRSSPPRKT